MTWRRVLAPPASAEGAAAPEVVVSCAARRAKPAAAAPSPVRTAAQGYPLFDALGFRLMSLLRVTLALSGLLMMPYWRNALAVLLLLYVVHSALIHGFVLYRQGLVHVRLWHWLDVAWGIAVMAASGGGESLYYLFFVYPIIVASLRSGTREGAMVTIAAVAGWLLIALLEAGSIAAVVRAQQVLPRALVLLVLGYAIALWAGFEALQRGRLQLLGELNRLPNPRFGPDPLMAATLEQLRAFYQADDCIAVLAGDHEPRLHRAKTRAADDVPTPADLPAKLLALPERSTVIANAPPRWLHCVGARLRVGRIRGREAAVAKSRARELGRSLGGRSWVSVPLELQGAAVGRLCLVGGRRRFGAFDAALLRQAMDKFMPLVETVRLLDGLATNAAEKERTKICLDLHDGAIQPYLGLKLGLEALRRKVEPGNPLNADIEELWRMTQDSVAELRGYVRHLGGVSQRSAATLVEGLQKQIDRFRSFYGMDIRMNLLSDMDLNDRLAAEIVQMVGEGLSNIGRHTDSRQVTINLSSSEDRLMTQIINHGVRHDAPWRDFTPASLTRRAQQLGGSIAVEPQACGGTAVLVTIPL